MATGKFKPKTNGATIMETSTSEEEVTTNVSETEGVENPVETVENSVEGVDEVTVNETIEQKPAVKNVKILPNTNHTCCIGGTRYFLKKGVQTVVPQEVKDILNKSGLLKPL